MSEKEMKMWDVKCRKCDAVTLQTNGYSIALDGQIVPFDPHYISFDCPNCKEKVVWDKRKDKNNCKK